MAKPPRSLNPESPRAKRTGPSVNNKRHGLMWLMLIWDKRKNKRRRQGGADGEHFDRTDSKGNADHMSDWESAKVWEIAKGGDKTYRAILGRGGNVL